jgi:hypothetical protein
MMAFGPAGLAKRSGSLELGSNQPTRPPGASRRRCLDQCGVDDEVGECEVPGKRGWAAPLLAGPDVMVAFAKDEGFTKDRAGAPCVSSPVRSPLFDLPS